ncbi:hypothetical protein Bca4012_056053 [Brassica carinata]
MTNTDIELVNKKWEGRKNATLQLVFMEFSNLTVVFFRKLSTALRMPSVVLGCGRCGSEEETFRLIKNQLMFSYWMLYVGVQKKRIKYVSVYFSTSFCSHKLCLYILKTLFSVKFTELCCHKIV